MAAPEVGPGWFDVCQNVVVVGSDAGVVEADAGRWVLAFKALGDPVRVRMVAMIAAVPELTVGQIGSAFTLSSGTVSHHLRTLREAGLVDSERRGAFVFYRIRPGSLALPAELFGRARDAA